MIVYLLLMSCVISSAFHLKIVITVSSSRVNHVNNVLIPLLCPSMCENVYIVTSNALVCEKVKDVTCFYTPKQDPKPSEEPYFQNTDRTRWLWFRQESLDIAFALSTQKDEYLLFLEDDVTPTSLALQKIQNIVERDMSVIREWHFLNLYSTTPWTIDADDIKVYKTFFHCCTQAFVLNKGFGPRLARYILDNVNTMPPDLLISTLKNNVSMNESWWPPLKRTMTIDDSFYMKTYEVTPSLFQHTPQTASTTLFTSFATHTSPTFVY